MFIRIELVDEMNKGKVHSFNRDLLNIGTMSDNHLVISNNSKDVEKYHCQIHREEEDVFLIDMGSFSGTFVNNEKIKKTLIKNDDRIKLGTEGPEFVVNFSLLDNYKQSASEQSHSNSHLPDNNDKIYGEKTVGQMINQALRSASLIKTGMYRSTSYFEALLEEKLKIKTRFLKIAALIFTLSIFIFLTFLTIFIFKSSNGQNQNQIVPLPSIDESESIAKNNKHNIYLLAGLPKSVDKSSNQYIGFCTAFAVSDKLLATDAHCIEKADNEFQTVMALLNETPGKMYKIVKSSIHPDYKTENISVDIGLLLIDGSLETHIEIAKDSELKMLTTGEQIYLYGFPHTLNSLQEPVATFTEGAIGRITTLERKVGSFKDDILIQHSAVTSEGTSGSPLFNKTGKVIAINAGGYKEDDNKLTGYNFSIRIDMLKKLINDFEDGDK